jgi:diguanylate cyclase (GGDEF)-like protein
MKHPDNSSYYTFAIEHLKLLATCVSEFLGSFHKEYIEDIKSKVHYFTAPKEINDIITPLEELHEYLNSKYVSLPTDNNQAAPQRSLEPIPIHNKYLPILKRAIMRQRRIQAVEIEHYKEVTHNADLLARLEDELRPFDELINQQWFQGTRPVPLPVLTDYFSVNHIEQILYSKGIRQDKREYDEKFHILQAPKLFLRDLNYYRATCDMRGVPVIAAQIDIDNFKINFNSKHGHTVVDRNVLPRFMACLESHVNSHGYSYRYGGDEYAMLIPSISLPLAVMFLDELRKKIAELCFRDIQEKTTVSIGFCVVDRDCYLTDREIEERTNRAMNFAKEQGKNCLATYRQMKFKDDRLQVVLT